MSSKIPSGFATISSAPSLPLNTIVNLMGVATDFRPPVKSGGKDWMCTFRLVDTTVYDDGFMIRYFRPMESEMPAIKADGDVVILHKVKIYSWSGMIIGLSCRQTNWTLLPAASIPERASSGFLNLKRLGDKTSKVPSQEEMRYAVELCNSRGDRAPYGSTPAASGPTSLHSTPAASDPTSVHLQKLTGSSPARGLRASSGRRDKFSLIKDVSVDTFYDLIGQVVKVYPSNGVVELYITDYTTNTALFSYEWGRDDPDAPDRKWRGPYGKMTLTVSLFSPHSYFAHNQVKEHDIVFLRNTRIKWSQNAKVEGSLHTDRRIPDRVDITILKDHNDDRIKDLLRRKREYAKYFEKQREEYVTDVNSILGQKRKQPEPKLSKNEIRKRRKLERGQERNAESLHTPDEDKENSYPLDSTSYQSDTTDAISKRITPSTSPPPAHPPKRHLTLNKNIRTTKPDLPTRPLSSILSLSTHTTTTPDGIPYTLPFQNIKSRAVVRIIDFHPPNLADFAVRRKPPSEMDVLSDYSGDSSSSSSSSSDNDNENEINRPLPPLNNNNNNDDDEDLEPHSQPENEYTADGLNNKWEWRFSLTIEDATTSHSRQQQQQQQQDGDSCTTLYVSDTDAVFLLKLDASDLHRRPRALDKLREKLFLLWGDLEETKSKEGGGGGGGERAKRKGSLPLECCVKEYGVRSRKRGGLMGGGGSEGESKDGEEDWGWERRFALFGTTIL
ncbi:MAG: hypothetical protein L6R37_003616 [Teloschistes peruensis]|nr:MAG: hypothetical protein L6R37_003616 [Teloschistes peruensis]